MGTMVASPDNMPFVQELFDDFIALGGNCLDTARVYGTEPAIGQWFDGARAARRRGPDRQRRAPQRAGAARQPAGHRRRHRREPPADADRLHRSLPAAPGRPGRARRPHRGGPQRAQGGRTHPRLRRLQLDPPAAPGGQRLRRRPRPDPVCRQQPQLQPGGPERADLVRLRLRLHPPRRARLVRRSTSSRCCPGPPRRRASSPGATPRTTPATPRWSASGTTTPTSSACAAPSNWPREKGTTPIQIALAYVLCQPFPTWALIGPRSPQETHSTAEGLDLTLTPDELAWLNLER